LDDVTLEHRLTVIEQGIARIDVTTTRTDVNVAKQNGRIAKLETWRTQITAIYGLILIAGPFVFFALNQMFGR
jgi:hypothetical protein